jgi:hypothetical protein
MQYILPDENTIIINRVKKLPKISTGKFVSTEIANEDLDLINGKYAQEMWYWYGVNDSGGIGYALFRKGAKYIFVSLEHDDKGTPGEPFIDLDIAPFMSIKKLAKILSNVGDEREHVQYLIDLAVKAEGKDVV